MKTRNIERFTLAALIAATGFVAACSDYHESNNVMGSDMRESGMNRNTLDQLRTQDPGIQRFIDNSYGYAIFPKVTKGAAGIGGAHGHGQVFEQGNWVGNVSLSQATIGAQLGGEEFAEVIFFQDKATLDAFKRGEVEFAANASAVAASKGAAASADYERGVAVFTMTRTGLMFEAAIGGQKFHFEPRQ